MSIEQRLARDIATVTGGVVVTDSDLITARNAVQRRIERRSHRERLVGVAAAVAAVVLLLVGIAVVQWRSADTETAPPAGPGPTASEYDFGRYLIGQAPTPELIQGVWRLDNGNVLMRFAAPDLISFDDEGRLFENPAVQGRYAIDGNLITITVDGGPAGCGGQEFAMRASLPEPGVMRVVQIPPGTGNCAGTPDELWVMEQVLPAGPVFASMTFSGETGWGPVPVTSALHGSWAAEGGGYVLELADNGEYHVAAGSGEQVDYGEWSLRGSRLTLRSWPDSVQCSASDQLILTDVEFLSSGTKVIRSTVQRNDCAAPWAGAVWFLIPHAGN